MRGAILYGLVTARPDFNAALPTQKGTTTSTTDGKLEVLTWEVFGVASRQLAVDVAASGTIPT